MMRSEFGPWMPSSYPYAIKRTSLVHQDVASVVLSANRKEPAFTSLTNRRLSGSHEAVVQGVSPLSRTTECCLPLRQQAPGSASPRKRTRSVRFFEVQGGVFRVSPEQLVRLVSEEAFLREVGDSSPRTSDSPGASPVSTAASPQVTESFAG
jgi:hypothetical protein